MNIRIRKAGKKIYFESIEKVNKEQLGFTNIFDFKEIIFEEEKLQEPFIIGFLEDLFTREQIEEVLLEKHDYVTVVCPIIQNISSISTIHLLEKKVVPSEAYPNFKSLSHVKKMICYQMTDYLFLECVNHLKWEIITNKKTFIKSNFMIANDLTTTSKMFYKKKVSMYDTYTADDFVDFAYFLKENKHLVEIDCYNHSETLFKHILESLLASDKKNITILFFQQDMEQTDLEEKVKKWRRDYQTLCKKKNLTLQIRYTKKYKEKYILKQFNLNMFRIILLLLLLFSASIYSITKIHQYHNHETKEIIEEMVEEQEETQEKVPEEMEEKKEEEKKKEEPKIETPKIYAKNFQNLKQINSEFTYYLTVPNTKITYPIVKHQDNQYYLNHSFDKSFNIYGWIFMDYRNNPNLTDQNTIIYGHDTYETSLFGTLKNVLKPDWYLKNKTILLESEKGKIEAEIFSIYTIPSTDDYLQIVFSYKEFRQFIDKITSRSIYNFQNKPKVTDRIITLSTCYKDDKTRLVLHAKISS